MAHDITFNDEQLNIIREAVELYVRLLLGQTDEVKLFLMRYRGLPRDYIMVDDALEQVKHAFFPELRSSAFYSINSPDVKQNVKTAFDLYQVLNILVKNSG